MKLSLLTCLLLLSSYQLSFLIPYGHANQVGNLEKLIRSQRSGVNHHPNHAKLFDIGSDDDNAFSSVYVGSQDGSMEADKIDALPGQPAEGNDFNQYGGYVTVDPNAGRALFYYFVESPQNSSTKPLVLWLNGGPGCSSLGSGAMEELGPFRVNHDGKTLFRNDFAWNNEANVLFLESPAGVGFSYSNTSTDYKVGDNRTARDTYTFLVNWLERFPRYKISNFFITGESYAGHYAPQLAYTILSQNKVANRTNIDLKGIAIGNAYVDYVTRNLGRFDYLWTHALNSDETNAGIHKHCNFTVDDDDTCGKYTEQSDNEYGNIEKYNIYNPLCNISSESKSAASTGSVNDFDPCSDNDVQTYLNLEEVQAALHVKPTTWSACSHRIGWTDPPMTVLPTIQELIASGISLWLYSGDTDAVVPVTSTRYAINTLNLTIESAWRPWYCDEEVGGYVVGYKGLTFATVRGAGHKVPSYQPERALTLFSYFLRGTLPPPPPGPRS